MPFLRDWSFNFGSTTTATAQACKLPSYQQNDLLLAICTTDTTAQTWSSSGWTQLFTTTNTSNLGVLWKIAGASETDPTFTYTGAETANVHILSIGDVNTSTPFNGTGGAGTGYRTAAISAARIAMPVLTTTVNNSLIIYINSESGTVVPGVLEGPCIWEDAMDGSAHSDGFSWGFKSTAGAVGSDVFANKNGTAAGVTATIGISPPAGGAAVIPAYCAGDSSIYVDPIHGVTAYNGNTAFAATVTTNFAATLGAQALANGTAAAAADVGINSYHSMGQITGVTTDGTYAGGALVLAAGNKPNVAGKNVIAHVKPSTPKVYQNTDNIAKATSKGVCFGMASSAGNYKWWHTHGFGTAWNSAQHVPMVINSQATALASAGTLVDTSVASFGFAISGTLAAPVFQFGSLWVLDTTVVAGGNAASPVGVPGIVKSCATGKERMSVLQEGASQMLILQPVQIGNGGTDPTYMNISGTATEFPQQRSVTDKQVYYNSVDNVCGLTFYPGASDNFDIRNAVFSSKSKFHWRWHASMSTSATVQTPGAQVINAGDVQLRGITYAGMSFTSCTAVQTNGATITGGTFKDSPLVVDTPTNAAKISSSTITKTTGTAHGIAIGSATAVPGSPASIALSGITFSGYAPSNGSTGNEAINVLYTSGTLTINVTGGGNTPSIKTAGATVNVVAGATVTFTGLPTGTDIVILTAGTSTILQQVDQNAGTTYAWGYQGTPTVDVGFIKPGYIPQYLRNLTLGTTDSSIPVALQADRNYL